MKWQTIETAPRDGTDVLVLFDAATVPIVHVAFYRGEQEWNDSGQYCGGWDTLEDWLGWWSYTRGSVSQEKLEGITAPAYWIPLPELPNGVG